MFTIHHGCDLPSKFGDECHVGRVEPAIIMRILFILPNIEALYMWYFEGAGCLRSIPTCGSRLRQLTLYFERPRVAQSWVPILSSLDASKLIALRTDVGKLSSAVSSFPRDIWERLTYLGTQREQYRYIQSTYLLNLRHPRHYVRTIRPFQNCSSIPLSTNWKH